MAANTIKSSLLVTKTRSCQEPLTIDDLDPRLQKALANIQINNVSSVQGLMAVQVVNFDVDTILYEGLGMGRSTGIIIGIFQWLIKKNQAASPPSVLNLTPTHELAIVLYGLIDGIAPGTAALVSKDIEITDLSNVNIIVGTPGTLHQCHTDRKIFFSTIRLVVYEEAERLLLVRPGALRDIKFLIGLTDAGTRLQDSEVHSSKQTRAGKEIKGINTEQQRLILNDKWCQWEFN